VPKRLVRLLWLACALHGFTFGAVAAIAEPSDPAEAGNSVQAAPSAVVDDLHEALYGIMKEAEALGYSGRYERIEPVVRECFDLDFMAQKSVGRHWKTASPEDQAQFLDSFHRYMTANYAGRFTGWSGQEFTTHGEEASARNTVLVRTTLHDPTDEDVKLDYRLRQTDAGWRIVDIYFNGTVSELALRRSEYSSLIKREGFDALLIALDERIDELGAPPDEDSS
jgi:phospholipid transport system substrate-binding protein